VRYLLSIILGIVPTQGFQEVIHLFISVLEVLDVLYDGVFGLAMDDGCPFDIDRSGSQYLSKENK
jgi:hypothetical protein